MHLWTEYENNTVAGKYVLGTLQRSEGRSGFFLTENAGHPATLRVTEALNDESELMARWQAAAVAAVKEPHLLPILDFGRTALEGVPLAWALIERSDLTLSDVLRDRPLTVDETKEVALAAGSALAALHAAGLVHEHVDVTNVVAVGEVVKLRCDCVRECVGEFEQDTPKAREMLRQRDVHDYALLLMRCLTPDLQPDRNAPLPAPFDRIVPRALDGTWPIGEILFALTGIRPAPPIQAAAAEPAHRSASSEPAAASSEPAAARPAKPQFRPRKAYVASAVSPVPVQFSGREPESEQEPEMDVSMDFDQPLATRRATKTALLAIPVPRRSNSLVSGSAFQQVLRPILARATAPASGPYWAGGAIAAALLAVVLWNTGGAHPATTVSARSRPKTSVAVEPAQQTSASEALASLPEQSASQNFLASMQPAWHVIAYTYNYEQQARNKAVSLQKDYFALQPHVYTPTGHAPFFVALGNGLGQDEAAALLQEAIRAGLPRDTYIRAF